MPVRSAVLYLYAIILTAAFWIIRFRNPDMTDVRWLLTYWDLLLWWLAGLISAILLHDQPWEHKRNDH